MYISQSGYIFLHFWRIPSDNSRTAETSHFHYFSFNVPLIDMVYWKLDFPIKLSDRNIIFKIIPPGIKKIKCPRLTSNIDCSEIFINAPRNMLAMSKYKSNYKRHHNKNIRIVLPIGNEAK